MRYLIAVALLMLSLSVPALADEFTPPADDPRPAQGTTQGSTSRGRTR